MPFQNSLCHLVNYARTRAFSDSYFSDAYKGRIYNCTICLRFIWKNKGQRKPIFYDLYGKIRVRENPYSTIYMEK